MTIKPVAMDEMLDDELGPYEESESWTSDRMPEMPLLGFITGSIFSAVIWTGVWLALRLIG